MNWGYDLHLLFKQEHEGQTHRASIKQGYWYLPLVFLCCLFIIPSTFALQIADNNAFMEYLQQEKINLTHAKTTASMLMEPKDRASLQLQQQRNKEQLIIVQGTIANLESFLQHQRQQQQALNSNLKKTTSPTREW